MEEADFGDVPHGIWTDQVGLTVEDLTIQEVYFHSIQLNPGSESPTIRNVKMFDAGEQFIKANLAGTFGEGADDGVVENCLMEYTNGPPSTNHGGGGIGYTNGVDVHGGDNWIIRGNTFKNFHTPDTADPFNYWNPAILMWNGSRNTLCENNVFINCDRAIAYGLIDRENDHQGGIIRNNMVYQEPNLFTPERTANSDASIIVWDSPNTQVLHNTILTNDNSNFAIELRFDSAGGHVLHNLTDSEIRARNPINFTQRDNFTSASPRDFIDPASGNLRLSETANAEIINQVTRLENALNDIDHAPRPEAAGQSDLGADER